MTIHGQFNIYKVIASDGGYGGQGAYAPRR